MVDIKFCRLTDTAVMPKKAHETDSGYDICTEIDFKMSGCAYRKIPTGIAAVIPEGYEIQVRPRSGLASRDGVHACLGTVDMGYRGEIFITLFSTEGEFEAKKGERIAQLVLCPVIASRALEIGRDELKTDTDRGTNGHGSTGR